MKNKGNHNQSVMKYNAKNIKQFKIALNKKTDIDIINFLETLDNKQGFMKDLIRKAIE